MSDPSPHPTRDELSAYSLGGLPPDKAVAIDSHISECRPCCETIVDISADDTFVGLLKEARQLPTDQTADHVAATASSSLQDIPVQLAEHPRYEILGPIGQGGMGDVYKARHRRMERTVALKVINRGLVQKADAVDRFHREAKAAAQLSHPNIVTAYDADQAGDFHFMVMEYVDGVDLSRTVKDRGALPVAEACDYIHQAAIGLEHAHQRGMVHRDIKPHNLMLTADSTLKILDFGLAALTPEVASPAVSDEFHSELTTAGAIMGTPDFISPEQAEDARQADARSDIYSLGATLYYLLSGRPPFGGGSVKQKLQRHAHAIPVRLESLRDDIPAELSAIVTQMLDKDPEKRFQTAFEVASALESFKQPVEESLPLQAPPTRSRHRLLPLLALATLFIAIPFAGVVFYLQTGHGTIRVAVLDDSLEATIQGETIKVEDGDKEFEINAGRGQLVIRQKGSDTEFVTDNFRVWRNDKIKFEVSLVAGEVVVNKNGKLFDSKRAEWFPPSIDADPTRDHMEPNIDGEGRAKETAVRGVGKVVALAPPKRPLSMLSPIQGIVRGLSENLFEGGQVTRGEILVEMEPAQAAVTQLRALAGELKNKLTTAHAKAEIYNESIVALEAAKVDAVAAAEQLLDAAKAKKDAQERRVAEYEAKELQARYNYKRQQRLLDKGASTNEYVEKVQRDWLVAASQLESTKLELTASRKEWEAKTNERKQKEREAEARVNAARAMQQEALGQVASIEKLIQDVEIKLSQLERFVMKAPHDGTLMRLNTLVQGQVIKEGEELFTIVPNRSDRAVELWISGNDVVLVQRGDQVRLRFEGWPAVAEAGTFWGEVVTVETTADDAGRFRILIKEHDDQPWPDERHLRPGVRAIGLILTESRTIGTHPLTIIDASGKRLLGGTFRTYRDDDLGATTHCFESPDGKYTITLEGEVLTVNDEKYRLEHPKDSIRIVNDRVEITRVMDLAQNAESDLEQLQGVWQVLAFIEDGINKFAAKSGNRMLLRIEGDMLTRMQIGTSGDQSEQEWGRIELNRDTDPKSIDIVHPDGSSGRLLGIYKLDKNNLILCFAERRSDGNADDQRTKLPTSWKRPTTFNSRAENSVILLECQRAGEDADLKLPQRD